MDKDLNLDNISCLEKELIEAIEHYQLMLDVQYYNMAKLWLEQIDIIAEKIRNI